MFPLTRSAVPKLEPCTWFLFLWAQCNRIPLIKCSWLLPHGGKVKRGWQNSSATAQPDPVKMWMVSKKMELNVWTWSVQKHDCSKTKQLLLLQAWKELREISSVREVMLFFEIALITLWNGYKKLKEHSLNISILHKYIYIYWCCTSETSLFYNWNVASPHRLLSSSRVAESMESLMLFPLITPTSHSVRVSEQKANWALR